jgi:uncharacterized OB-fold protein
MKEYKKPLPKPTPWSKFFWDSCKEEKLCVQRCNACKKNIFYPKLYCPFCLSSDLTWIRASGKGRIYSYMVVYAYQPTEFQEDVPYVVAVIDLEEGVRMMSNIVDCNPEEVHCDDPVEVVFEKVNEAYTLPKFRPIKS